MPLVNASSKRATTPYSLQHQCLLLGLAATMPTCRILLFHPLNKTNAFFSINYMHDSLIQLDSFPDTSWQKTKKVMALGRQERNNKNRSVLAKIGHVLKWLKAIVCKARSFLLPSPVIARSLKYGKAHEPRCYSPLMNLCISCRLEVVDIVSCRLE